jgi:hypothetical protein
MDFDALMSGDALQNGGYQSPFYLGIQRNRHSLKPRIQSFKANMSPDLLDKMVIPMPG